MLPTVRGGGGIPAAVDTCQLGPGSSHCTERFCIDGGGGIRWAGGLWCSVVRMGPAKTG